MKPLFLYLVTLAFTTTLLNAETFLDRFKIVEDKVEELTFEINNIKNGTPSAPNSKDKVISQHNNSSVNNNESEQLQNVKNSLRGLEYQQRALIKELLLLKQASKKASLAQQQPAEIIKGSKASQPSKDPVESDEDSQDTWGDDEEQESDESEMAAELENIHSKLSALRKATNGNHIKIDADFRTSVDNLRYTMADGSIRTNDAFFSNRLWLDFKYKATQNSSFTAQLAYNKAYGQRRGTDQQTGSLNNLSGFDWVTNTVVNDDTVRVKKAYWFYQNGTFLGMPVPWTFSLGRRPSTNGHLINLRDDDSQSSPLAHFVNVEFDGGSSKFDLTELTGINGLYLKFCFGRGLTNATEKFSATPYATNSNDIDQVDMLGVIVSLYDDGQYSLVTQTVRALNLIDVDINMTTGAMASDFYTTGNINNFTVQFEMSGIGNNWSNFLDKTLFFASYSITQTEPLVGQTMFGSANQEIGSSYWLGLQVPAITKKGKIGLEYNHGDKYWRSITYAEDTMTGSKIAVRGDAYEAYWTEYIDDALSIQLRYTYIDYSHTGSNGFFGGDAAGTSGTGTPFTIAEALAGGLGSMVVDTAQDIRLYLRYRY